MKTFSKLRSVSTGATPSEVISGVILLMILAMATIGSWLLWVDPAAQDLYAVSAPPGSGHLLGTDALGRDILARVISGTALTVIGPVVVAGASIAIATSLALVAVHFGGHVEAAVMRVSDTLLALPSLLVLIVVVGIFGGSYAIAVTVLTVLILPSDLRVVRSVILGQMSLPYLEAARTMRVSAPRRMFVHILPNLAPTAIACFLLNFVGALMALSALAFLGLGAPPGATDWGSMLSENRLLLSTNPAALVTPAILLVVTGFAVTTIGDWVHRRVESRNDAH